MLVEYILGATWLNLNEFISNLHIASWFWKFSVIEPSGWNKKGICPPFVKCITLCKVSSCSNVKLVLSGFSLDKPALSGNILSSDK